MRCAASKYSVTLKTELGVVQGIENGAVRYIIYDFLLVGRRKYNFMLYHYFSYLTLNNRDLKI